MSGIVGVAVFILIAVQPALAQRPAAPAKDYPSRFIRIVVPYGAGAGPDVVGRTLAEKMRVGLGQNIVFENRGGGGGVPGTDLVAKAAPDGYTLLLQTANYATYPLYYKNLPYDPVKDFLPVALLARTVGYVLVVNPVLPARTVKEFIALAKAHPGKLNHGSSSFGVPAELFSKMTGVKMTLVRYAGVPAVLTDVISGQIEVAFPAAPSAMPFVQSGRLRVLGITGGKRWNKLPQAPTLHEAGVSGYKLVGWYGFWFPAGTPGEYVSRIQNEVTAALKDAAVRQRFDEQGLEGVGSLSRELIRATEEEFELNQSLAARMGVVPQ